MEEKEALQKAQEHINEEIDCFLQHIVETKERVKGAKTVPELMSAQKYFMEGIVEALPLEGWHNPFCWMAAEKTDQDDKFYPWEYRFPTKKEDCKECDYAKTYGNCFEKRSVFDRIDKSRWRLLHAIEKYWKDEKSHKKEPWSIGAPG